MTVNDLLVEGGFDDLFNESYTARMEEELDEIEEGKLELDGRARGVLREVRARPEGIRDLRQGAQAAGHPDR